MRKILDNKKGAEMAISTIIVIALGLVILVILIMGFSSGWSNLWEKVTGFGGGKVNVQSVIQGCELACTTSAQYDYCGKTSTLTFTTDKDSPDFKKNGKYNCKGLEGMGVGLSCSEDFGECEAITPTTIAADAKKCEGTATSCEDITTNTNNACDTQDDCSWEDGACTGTATACDKITGTGAETKCKAQTGCSWI